MCTCTFDETVINSHIGTIRVLDGLRVHARDDARVNTILAYLKRQNHMEMRIKHESRIQKLQARARRWSTWNE